MWLAGHDNIDMAIQQVADERVTRTKERKKKMPEAYARASESFEVNTTNKGCLLTEFVKPRKVGEQPAIDNIILVCTTYVRLKYPLTDWYNTHYNFYILYTYIL